MIISHEVELYDIEMHYIVSYDIVLYNILLFYIFNKFSCYVTNEIFHYYALIIAESHRK